MKHAADIIIESTIKEFKNCFFTSKSIFQLLEKQHPNIRYDNAFISNVLFRLADEGDLENMETSVEGCSLFRIKENKSTPDKRFDVDKFNTNMRETVRSVLGIEPEQPPKEEISIPMKNLYDLQAQLELSNKKANDLEKEIFMLSKSIEIRDKKIVELKAELYDFITENKDEKRGDRNE